MSDTLERLQISLRVPAETVGALDRIARALDRDEGVDLDAVLDEADAIVARAKAEQARKAG